MNNICKRLLLNSDSSDIKIHHTSSVAAIARLRKNWNLVHLEQRKIDDESFKEGWKQLACLSSMSVQGRRKLFKFG